MFQQVVDTTENRTSSMSSVQAAFASSGLVQFASFLHQFQDNVPRAIRVLQHALVQPIVLCPGACVFVSLLSAKADFGKMMYPLCRSCGES